MRIGLTDYRIQSQFLQNKQGQVSVPSFGAICPNIFRNIHDLQFNETMPTKDIAVENNTPLKQIKAASELFKYGIDALDENTLFIATNNRENTNFVLKKYKENIEVPIFKTYILEVKEENSKTWHREPDANFAIYKKNGEYYIIGLGNLFGVFVKDTKEEKNSLLKPGEVRKLEPNSIIEFGIRSNSDNDAFLNFVLPEKINPEKADAYLERITVDPIAHNSAAVAAITSNKIKKGAKTKKEFTFKDIGGLDHIIEDLRKFVIRPVNYPEVFENIRLNKGILLYGPPRCGKTLIGKALANEAGIDFKYMNASEFTKTTHGASEEKARDVFRELMEKPSILFIDEIDGIGKQRSGSGNAHYDDKFLTQLLGLMSDLEKSEAMSFVMAATNRKDLLDTALLATGRFGLQLEVPLPNAEGIEQIFNIHAQKQNFEADVSIKDFIPLMIKDKFNGSDIAEFITLGYFNALDRLGLNKKMDAKVFNYHDLKSIKISKSDLMKAYKSLAKQKI